jgi:hypothetical protein
VNLGSNDYLAAEDAIFQVNGYQYDLLNSLTTSNFIA